VVRNLAILVALALFLGACSSTDARSESLQQLADAEFRLTDCLSDAGRGAEAILIEAKFEAMQQIIREDGVDALDERQTTMFTALQEPTVLGTLGISYVDYLGPAYTPGQTTMADLRQEAGLLEVLDFSLLASQLWDDRRYEDPLKEECDANNVGALETICARDVSEACRDLLKYEDRDKAAIAEACALAPYLAPCEPENPPPFYPPNVRDDYRLPIPERFR